MAPAEIRLRDLGWNLSADGLQQISENGSITDTKKLVRNAIDLDLRDISNGTFPDDINKGKLEFIPGNIVVQVQKVRNVSAPKMNEESRGAPRMLKVSVTDGVAVTQALEVESIPSLSLNTVPGTKLFLKGEALPMVHGIVLLKPANVEVLGGKVSAMVEKWELNRSLAKHTRGRVGEEGGPPPWIPFGQKILRVNPQDRNFKSLESSKDKDNRENAEFEAQRKDAIAEAARSSGAKKVFGGGIKPQLLDHSVQQIVDYGFTADQAEQALRLTRNNWSLALRNLQRGVGVERSFPDISRDTGSRDTGSRDTGPRDTGPRDTGPRDTGPRDMGPRDTGPRDRDRHRPPDAKGREEEPARGERRERRKRNDRMGGDREDEGGAAPKPSAKVSLFDFLEDKLPVSNEKEPDSRNSTTSYQYGDRKLSADSYQYRGNGGNSRGSRPERGGFSQGQGRVSSAMPAYGGRGGNTAWSDRNGKERGRQNTYPSRDDRYDRNRQNNTDRPSQPLLYQQKPPRFQNQQRYQPQEAPPAQQHNWAPAFNENNFSVPTWNARKPPPNNIKAHDNDYPNIGRDNFDTRNRNARPFGNSYETDKTQRYDISGTGRNNMSNIDGLSIKLSAQHLNKDNYYQKPPPNPMPSQNSVFPTLLYGARMRELGDVGFGGTYLRTDNLDKLEMNSREPANLNQNTWVWHKGDKCMAKYWEDNMYYNAEVTGVSERTCVVRFLEYGNHEEVLQDDCIPFTEEINQASLNAFSDAFYGRTNPLPPQQQPFNQNQFSGVLEFRRGEGSRPLAKAGADGGVGSGADPRRPPRSQPQPMYMPPAQRK